MADDYLLTNANGQITEASGIFEAFGGDRLRTIDEANIARKLTSLGSQLTRLQRADGGEVITFASMTPSNEFSAVADLFEEGFAIFDADMRFTFANRKYSDLILDGVSPPKPGRRLYDVARDLARSGAFVMAPDRSPEDFANSIQLAGRHPGRATLHRRDGRVLEIATRPSDSGGCVVTVLDATPRVTTEAALQDVNTADGRLEDALESLAQPFALFDPDDLLIVANKSYREANPGSSHTMVRGAARADIIAAMAHADDIVETQEWVGRYVLESARRETATPRSYQLTHRNGTVYLATRASTSEGGCIIVWLDVTDTKHAEEAVRARLAEAVDALEEGIALFDEDFRFVLGNSALREIFFRSVSWPEIGEHGDETVRRLIAGGVFDTASASGGEALVQGSQKSAKAYLKNQVTRLAEGRLLSISSHETRLGGYMLTYRDITAGVDEENRTRAILNDAIQALGQGVAIYDQNLKFVRGNNKLEEFFFADRSSPEPGEHMLDTMGQLYASGHWTLTPGIPEKEFKDFAYEFLRSYKKQVKLRSRDGRRLVGSCHRTGLDGYLITFDDVTTEHLAEEELARQREIAHQTEKLSALGELLAGVAHELNNPLSIVVGYAMMLEQAIEDPIHRKRVAHIGAAAERCARIVKTFLAMARQRPAAIERCSLNEIVETAVEVAGYGLRTTGGVISLDLDPALPDVEADADQIAQVFSNLIVNAEQAMAEMGADARLNIKSSFDTQSGKVVIHFRDFGPGVPEDIALRIFEPFFTTKDIGAGTGVGLAFCHRVIDSHGGQIYLRSRPGFGANFYVQLRPAATAVAPTLKPDATTHISARVLIVDDDIDVGETFRIALEQAGCAVEFFADPRAALDRAQTEPFDAVLCDMKMPSMNGAKFLAALSDQNPDLARKFAFVTGDAMNARDTFGRPVLDKPATPQELINLVATLAQEEPSQ